MSALPDGYQALIDRLTAEAIDDPAVTGLLLTGSAARRDALPGTDIDLRYLTRDEPDAAFTRTVRDQILLEGSYAVDATAEQTLRQNPMHVYAYLDGRILYDPVGGLQRLREVAEKIFLTYRTPAETKDHLADNLQHPRGKIRVALDAADLFRATFVAGTCSWQIIEGLWAVNDRPLPPNGSVRAHLDDLAGPPDVDRHFRQLFLADPAVRAGSALFLLEWTIDRLTGRVESPPIR